MPARNSSAPEVGSVASKNRTQWMRNGCKPNPSVKAKYKTTTVQTEQKVSPAAMLSPEQLGTKAAFAHADVVKYGKRTITRKAAKRFIDLYGKAAYDAKLTQFEILLGVCIEQKVKQEFAEQYGESAEITFGINAAWYALEATYVGAPKPAASDNKSAVVKPEAKPSAPRGAVVKVTNRISSTLKDGQASKMHRVAKASIQAPDEPISTEVIVLEEHLVLSDN